MCVLCERIWFWLTLQHSPVAGPVSPIESQAFDEQILMGVAPFGQDPVRTTCRLDTLNLRILISHIKYELSAGSCEGLP